MFRECVFIVCAVVASSCGLEIGAVLDELARNAPLAQLLVLGSDSARLGKLQYPARLLDEMAISRQTLIPPVPMILISSDIQLLEFVLTSVKKVTLIESIILMNVNNATDVMMRSFLNPFRVYFVQGSSLQLSCEGTSETSIINVWSGKQRRFIKSIDLSAIGEMCIKVIQEKTLIAGCLATPPRLIMSKSKIRGTDPDTYKLLSKRLGFKLRLALVRKILIRSNATGRIIGGHLGKIITGTHHFGIGLIDAERYGELEVSIPIHLHQLAYVSAASTPVIKVDKAFFAFELRVWIWGGVTYLCVVLVASAITKYEHKSANLPRWTMKIISIISEQSFPRMWAWRSHRSLHLLLGCIILASFVTSSAFRGNILASLVTVNYEEPLVDSKAVYYSTRNFYYFNGSLSIFNSLRSSVNTYAHKNLEISLKKGHSLPPLAFTRPDFIPFMKRSKIIILQSKSFARDRGLQASEEVISSGTMPLLINSKLPWAKEFHKQILWYKDFGIHAKLGEDAARSFFLLSDIYGKLDTKDKDHKPVQTKLVHLLSAFFVLAAGVALGLARFFWEVGWRLVHSNAGLRMYD